VQVEVVVETEAARRVPALVGAKAQVRAADAAALKVEQAVRVAQRAAAAVAVVERRVVLKLVRAAPKVAVVKVEAALKAEAQKAQVVAVAARRVEGLKEEAVSPAVQRAAVKAARAKVEAGGAPPEAAGYSTLRPLLSVVARQSSATSSAV
jgi:hypothetical protein